MAKRQSWRKAYGALKDSTTVSLANLNSDFKELDVSIVKATNHVECPPKERHIRSQKNLGCFWDIAASGGRGLLHTCSCETTRKDSQLDAWDCFAWVRTYSLFLEERLECFRLLKYGIETESLFKPTEVSETGYSRMRELNSKELLEQLPALQQLLHRLIGCRMELQLAAM